MPEPARVQVVYQLVAALAAAALFSMAPAVWDVIEYARSEEATFVAPWAYVLLLAGLVQLAYVVYLAQLPDWTTVWVVTLYCVISAAAYAMVLGVAITSRESGQLITLLSLEDKLAGGKAALWCLCMIGVTSLLAIFAGLVSHRWQRAEAMLRGVKRAGA